MKTSSQQSVIRNAGKSAKLGISTFNNRCSNLLVRSFETRTTHTLGRYQQAKEREASVVILQLEKNIK